jgi:tripartite-type tricarboxylate transporter receptor subunit TctC
LTKIIDFSIKEQGIDVVVDLWRWIVVPKSTPADRVKILAASLKNILHDRPTVPSMEKIGCFVSYLPPEDYEKTMSASEGVSGNGKDTKYGNSGF